MKNIIGWIKSNLVTVASIVLVIASLGVIVWSYTKGSAAAKDTSKDLNKMAQQLRSYQSTTVPFPPANVDDPPEEIPNVIINQATLTRLDDVYGKMDREAKAVYVPTEQSNQAGHKLLVPGVLPKTDANHLRHEARTAYRAAFVQMLEPYDASTPDAPRLDATMPLDPAALDWELKVVEDGFRPTDPTIGTGGGLSESDRKRLNEQKADRAKEMLVDQARSAHIYTDTFPQSAGFPFQVDAWSLSTSLPSYDDIWHSQMDLWIQQDIVRAIGKANRVSDPKASVIDAPVKRLISIMVIPGDVGIDSKGGMGIKGADRSSGGGSRPAYGAPSSYAAPTGTTTPAATPGNPDKPLGVNFKLSPSGRISNVIYDVRHARVVMVVDYEQLPKLFDAISSVNFMTVLDCQIQDVDEYQALTQGYVYGQGDAVQVDMLIESVWLRNWTKQYMPEDVRQHLGIPDPKTDETADESQT